MKQNEQVLHSIKIGKKIKYVVYLINIQWHELKTGKIRCDDMKIGVSRILYTHEDELKCSYTYNPKFKLHLIINIANGRKMYLKKFIYEIKTMKKKLLFN